MSAKLRGKVAIVDPDDLSQIVLPLLQILHCHLTTAEDLSLEWHRSFPLDILLAILSQFAIVCQSVSRVDLLQSWLLCLSASSEFSYTVISSDILLRDLAEHPTEIQLNVESGSLFLDDCMKCVTTKPLTSPHSITTGIPPLCLRCRWMKNSEMFNSRRFALRVYSLKWARFAFQFA
jgi:hypothetical protein